MSRRVRHPVKGVIQAPAVTTMRIRTRLRPSQEDMVVLASLGQHFSRLLGKDLAGRCEAGESHDKVLWAARKQALTSECSSRWAGWVTKSSNEAYATARRNGRRALADKRRRSGRSRRSSLARCTARPSARPCSPKKRSQRSTRAGDRAGFPSGTARLASTR